MLHIKHVKMKFFHIYVFKWKRCFLECFHMNHICTVLTLNWVQLPSYLKIPEGTEKKNDQANTHKISAGPTFRRWRRNNLLAFQSHCLKPSATIPVS